MTCSRDHGRSIIMQPSRLQLRLVMFWQKFQSRWRMHCEKVFPLVFVFITFDLSCHRYLVQIHWEKIASLLLCVKGNVFFFWQPENNWSFQCCECFFFFPLLEADSTGLYLVTAQSFGVWPQTFPNTSQQNYASVVCSCSFFTIVS